MAVYPCHRSVLVVKPTKISSSDFEELKSEINKNPLDVLDWLIDNNCPLKEENSIPFEQTEFGGYYSEDHKAFIFYNCLLNTADVAEQLGFDKKEGPAKVVELVDKHCFTNIRSKNGQFRIIVADSKCISFVNNFSKKKEVLVASKEIKGRGLTKKILIAIKNREFASSVIDNDDVESALKKMNPPWIRGRDYSHTSISSSLDALRKDNVLDKTDRRGKWKIRDYQDAAVVVSTPASPQVPLIVPAIIEAPVTGALTGHSAPEKKQLIDRIMSSDLDKDTKLKIIAMTLS